MQRIIRTIFRWRETVARFRLICLKFAVYAIVCLHLFSVGQLVLNVRIFVQSDHRIGKGKGMWGSIRPSCYEKHCDSIFSAEETYKLMTHLSSRKCAKTHVRQSEIIKNFPGGKPPGPPAVWAAASNAAALKGGGPGVSPPGNFFLRSQIAVREF